MSMLVVTHSGPFHADDVLAWSLLTVFLDDEMSLKRTRDAAQIEAADVVFDVGGQFDPQRGRFDHHQRDYIGDRSSAGMVLDWLEAQGKVSEGLAVRLRRDLVTYVDAVDNGRRVPGPGVPCFSTIVGVMGQVANDLAEFDEAFHRAAEVGRGLVGGLRAGFEKEQAAEAMVVDAMAQAQGPLMELSSYVKWQPAYFANGGKDHPTAFVLFPGLEGTWRVVCIPPEEGNFGQKVSLPASWAGLKDDELAAVTGISDAIFCHKNRFIAVFGTRESALKALGDAGLI